jgi:PAS domain S-box-containing protein
MSDSSPSSGGEALVEGLEPREERALDVALLEAARDRAEEEERRMSFLAEAGTLLSSSLHYETTLQTLARLTVPRLADWCAIDLVEADGELRRVVTAHTDPEKERTASELHRRYPPDPSSEHGVHHVLRTGRAVLVPEIPAEVIRRSAHDEEHARILTELRLRSYMIVPMISPEGVLGTITFVCAESEHAYAEKDLRLAEQLASRAALAIQQARLYRAAEESRARVTQVLESITDAFFALDRDWKFTYANREAEKVLQQEAQGLLGRVIWEAFPGSGESEFGRQYRHAMRTGQTVQFEALYEPLSAWFDVRAFPSEDGLAVYFRDVSERRSAEQALHYQSYITRTITENATAALFMMDDRGRCTYMNPAAEAMTGYTLAEIRDMPLHDAIHHQRPDGRPYPMSECPIDRALPEDFSVRAHADVFIRKDGSMFPVLCAASPIFRDGVPVGTVVEVRDVTAEKQAQEALRASERQFRFLADAIPQQVWVALPDGHHEYYNQRWYEYTGATEEQSAGTGWANVLHPDDVERAGARWARSLETGEPYTVEYRFRRHDGVFRWFLGQALAQRDDQGNIIRWFGTLTDIQDRKEAESERERLIRELEVERGRLRHIFQKAPAFIATLRGPDHVFETVNPPYMQLIGNRPVLGKAVSEAMPEVVEQGFVSLLDRVFQSGEPFIGNEVPVTLQGSDGQPLREHFVNFVYQPLLEAGGTVSGILVHGVDVTEQVLSRQEVERKAEELSRLARALELSNRELDQFAYVASHDLKAPLRGIANLSTWIEEDLGGEVTPQVREHLDLLRGRAHRMEGLIDGVLQYSRAGRVLEAPVRTDVSTLLREIVDLLAPPAGVEIRLAEDLPVLVTERVPLQQALMNLLGNAVKYAGGEGAEVRVAAEDRGDRVEFAVADNGPGIAPEYHDRIFGIFQTLEARDRVEGTGIGLSLVKKLVESRGGRVWVESEEGAGATFRFTWPKEPMEAGRG